MALDTQRHRNRTMALETVLTVGAALAGALFSALLILIVMPKIDNACQLPMPPLPSYWIGHVSHFLDIRRLLHTNLAWFRDLGDVFQIWLVARHVVVTANPRDVVHILANPNLFARPHAQISLFNDLQPDNFQTMSRDLHRVHRKRLRDAFSPTNVRNFAAAVSRAATAFVASLECDTPINLTPHVADTTFAVLLDAVLGSRMDPEKRAEFARTSQSLLRELLIEYFTYPLRRIFAFTGVRRNLFRKHRQVLQYTDDLIKAREAECEGDRTQRLPDVLDVIRQLDPNDRSRQVSNATMFAMAGFESSSEAVAWAVYEIVGNPKIQPRIQAELDDVLGDRPQLLYDDVQKLSYLHRIWKETLRLHPAAGFMLRVATKDVVLPGSRVNIPQGVQVGVLIAGAQRNPRFISDPDAFLPSRWETSQRPAGTFVPYSCGPERCPGQALADYEGVAILAALFRSFNVELACPRDSVVGVSDWTERARGPAPGAPIGDTSWTLPVRLTRRTQYNQ